MDSRALAQSRPWLAVGREIAELLERVDAGRVRKAGPGFRRPCSSLVLLRPGPFGAGRADGRDALHAYRPHRAFRRRSSAAVDPKGDGLLDHLRLGRDAGQRRFCPYRQGRGRQGGDADAQAEGHARRASPTSRLPVPVETTGRFGGSLFEQCCLILLDSVILGMADQLPDAQQADAPPPHQPAVSRMPTGREHRRRHHRRRGVDAGQGRALSRRRGAQPRRRHLRGSA